MLGLIIAVLIKDMKSKVGRSFAQVCLFLPRVIPGAAAGVAWTWMLADKGTANQLLRAVGLGDFAHVWLGDQSPSLNAVGVIGFLAAARLLCGALALGHRRHRPVPVRGSKS